MNETLINNILGWFVILLFISVCSAVLLYELVFLVGELVTRQVRVRSRQGLMNIFCIGLCLAALNWMIGGRIVYDRIIGGTAFNGKIVGHKYFLGSHDKYVEVSSDFWSFSYWYQVTTYVFVSFFMAGAGIIWLLWGRGKGGKEAYSTYHINESLKEHDRRHPWGKG